jgi:hypothetical protein
VAESGGGVEMSVGWCPTTTTTTRTQDTESKGQWLTFQYCKGTHDRVIRGCVLRRCSCPTMCPICHVRSRCRSASASSLVATMTQSTGHGHARGRTQQDTNRAEPRSKSHTRTWGPPSPRAHTHNMGSRARRSTELTPQTVVTVGWIPFIIWVGYRNSNPQPSLIK